MFPLTLGSPSRMSLRATAAPSRRIPLARSCPACRRALDRENLSTPKFGRPSLLLFTLAGGLACISLWLIAGELMALGLGETAAKYLCWAPALIVASVACVLPRVRTWRCTWCDASGRETVRGAKRLTP